jgi:hypothetical protein
MGVADSGGTAFEAFVEKTDFARNALDAETRRRLYSLADRALKEGGGEAGGKYAAALLTALRDASPEGPIRDAADRAVSLLSPRKTGQS